MYYINVPDRARVTNCQLDALVYTFGCVTLLLWEMLVLFDDLIDLLKKGANLRLGTGVFFPITGWFGMFQYLLQRLPVNPFTSEYLSFTRLSSQYLKAYLCPPVHICVHSSLLLRIEYFPEKVI